MATFTADITHEMERYLVGAVLDDIQGSDLQLLVPTCVKFTPNAGTWTFRSRAVGDGAYTISIYWDCPAIYARVQPVKPLFLCYW